MPAASTDCCTATKNRPTLVAIANTKWDKNHQATGRTIGSKAARSLSFVLGSLADLKNSDRQDDVVIVGGGAAGLTLAHALGAAGRSVLLLEAGGDKRTKASQEFYRGELV